MLLYGSLHLLKFVGVMLLAGGMIGGFLTRDPVDRKRAVHGVASAGLLLTWLAGYALSLVLGVTLGELWISGGLLLSFASYVALVLSVSRPPSKATALTVFGPLTLTLMLMVFRPTWAMVLG